jgi:hypothetical protein
MRAIGFSTGALAKGDFREGIKLQVVHPGLRAIELSALRDHELASLSLAVSSLDVRAFQYVSVHAPSKLSTVSEDAVLEQLSRLPSGWPLVVHPELIGDESRWEALGPRLCLENMDGRKTTGRTVVEMRELLRRFPEAGFCLDLGHARQVDPTMATAVRMVREFGPRLRQLHVSEVGEGGKHLPLSVLAIYAFQLVAPLIPETCPVIIESVVPANAIESESRKIAALFAVEHDRFRSLDTARAIAG